MNDQTLFSIFFSAMVVNNFTLALFLGLCPFMGVSARVETALRMGLANIFVMLITAQCSGEAVQHASVSGFDRFAADQSIEVIRKVRSGRIAIRWNTL